MKKRSTVLAIIEKIPRADPARAGELLGAGEGAGGVVSASRADADAVVSAGRGRALLRMTRASSKSNTEQKKITDTISRCLQRQM